MKIRNNSKLTAGLTGVLMILFIMLTGGTALASGTGSTGSGITAQTVYTYEDDAMKVTATLSDGSAIPAGSTLKVDALTDQTTDENVKALYTDAKTMIDNQAANEKYTLDSFAAYNIYFKKDDNTYVPSTGTMTLEVTYKAANAPEAYTKSTAGSKAVVVYQKTQIKDILGNSTYILSNLGTAKDADQKDIISKKELDESGNLKALTFKESTYLPVILAWTENNAQAAANGAVTPTPTAAPSVTAAPTAEPSTTADENTDTTVTPTAEPSATAAPSTTVENGNDSGTDKADAANNTVNKDDFTLGDNQTTNEALVDGSTGSGILTDNTAKGVTSTDANGKKIKTYTYKSDDVTVTVTADDTSALPDGAVLKVTPVRINDAIQGQLDKKAIEKNRSIKNTIAYDISFQLNGMEVEPSSSLNVSVSSGSINSTDISVYHIEDVSNNAEDVNATVKDDGTVDFSSNKFSTFVIANTGSSTVNVTLNYYDSTTNKLIYKKSNNELKVDEGIKTVETLKNYSNYIIKDENGKTLTTPINVTSDKTFYIFCTPSTDSNSQGPVSFYDYTVKYYKAASYVWDDSINGWKLTEEVHDSINSNKNYSNQNATSPRLTSGTKDTNGFFTTNGGWELTNWNCPVKIDNIEYDANTCNYGMATTGLVTGLDASGNVAWSVDQPGFFTNTTNTCKTIYNNFKLKFTRTGDTYILTNVMDDVDNTKSVTSAGSDNSAFFPLEKYKSSYEQCDTGHNYYFGMRYDVNFTLGDYQGDLKYNFTGDDDMWVILDGKYVVIDDGGIHNAVKKNVNLWSYLKAETNNDAAVNYDENAAYDSSVSYDKTKTHTLTVLYMERGANISTCGMDFTLPNAEIVQVSNLPKTTVDFTKVAEDGTTGLAGAVFTMTDTTNTNKTYTATSNSNGNVTFNGVLEGTYTMKETTPPTGYYQSNEEYTVTVAENSDGTFTKTIKDSSGNTVTSIKNESIASSVDYHKTATVSNWTDRTYNITLDASSLKTITSGGGTKAMDVVLVLDTSGSMAWPESFSNSVTVTTAFLDKSKIYYFTKNEENGYWYKAEYYHSRSGSGWRYYIYSNSSYANTADSQRGTISSNEKYTFYATPSSTSRNAALKNAATKFVDQLKENSANSQVAIVPFSETAGTPTQLTDVTSGYDTLTMAINALGASGGTNQGAGLSAASDILSKDSSGNDKIIVLVTDGAPDGSSGGITYKTSSEKVAATLRTNKVPVYTIGVSLIDTTSSWLKKSIATDSDHAYAANNQSELLEAFQWVLEKTKTSVTITGAVIKDYIDSRFIVTDAGGGTVKTDSKGNTYIEWNTDIAAKDSSGNPGWSKTITVKAEDSYIGGNAVDTNGADSGITIGDTTINFPRPQVNVRSVFAPGSDEKTIFWGDTVQSAYTRDDSSTTLDTALKTKILASTVAQYNLSGYAVGMNDFTLSYYSDEACTNPITDLASLTPEELDNTYYVKVVYNKLGQATAASSAATMVDGVKKVSGDAGTYSEGTDTNNLTETTTFKVHVVKGQIEITKKIVGGQYSNINAINSNQTFIFKVQRYASVNSDGTPNGSPLETFYETLNFNANEGITEKTAIISQLKKGYYKVTEETSWSPKYKPAVTSGEYAQGYDVGAYKGAVLSSDATSSGSLTTSDINKIKFTGLEITSNTNANKYAAYAVNVDANGTRSTTILNNTFTNTLKSNWNWLSDTAAAVNQFTKTRN